MPCFRPLTGFRSARVNPATGKRSIVFSRSQALFPVEEIALPCGQCIHCRLEHSRQWALRCFHEAQLYEDNCFLTLTYNDEHLPKHGFLDYDAPVLFMKRLRKRFGVDIRSFGCAEYGELGSRPHYHICLFNFDFDDKEFFKFSYGAQGEKFEIYTSQSLSELWPYGHASVGGLSFESAAYVARYCTKKVTGERASSHYEYVCQESGEVLERPRERAVCVSRRPGIGKRWWEKFGKLSMDHDFMYLRGRKVRPAKYYDRLFDILDPDRFEEVKRARVVSGSLAAARLEKEDADNRSRFWLKGGFSRAAWPTPRLYVLERIHELKFEKLKRGLEDG